MDRRAGRCVSPIGDYFAGIGIASNSVLRSEEGGDFDIGRTMQDVDQVCRVNPRGMIDDEADAPLADRVEAIICEDARAYSDVRLHRV
jgi:hypothetical protein